MGRLRNCPTSQTQILSRPPFMALVLVLTEFVFVIQFAIANAITTQKFIYPIFLCMLLRESILTMVSLNLFS